MANITSFDVFDTVLTRTVGSPTSVFLLLGRRLHNMALIDCTPEAFARARFKAGVRALKNADHREVALFQIYTELGAALRLTEEQSNRLMHLEIKMEAELIRAVPGAQDRVRNARAQSQRVVFLSDMYLTSTFIQNQLKKHKMWSDRDKLFVSCEYAKKKASGELYREFLLSEGVLPESVLHSGNDHKADNHSAKRVGIQVDPFLDANLNRYEQILESYNWVTEGLSSVMAGASRLARLNIPAYSTKEKVLSS
ncbi:MAG: hypothetical protein ACE5KZ_15585 [Candidatus Scalinduaceae bacterium]